MLPRDGRLRSPSVHAFVVATHDCMQQQWSRSYGTDPGHTVLALLRGSEYPPSTFLSHHSMPESQIQRVVVLGSSCISCDTDAG